MASPQAPTAEQLNGDEEEEVTEEEEEEEDEPRLKYQRLGHTVSCLAAHEKFLVRFGNNFSSESDVKTDIFASISRNE
jgi:Mg2+/Co2+ transporter CorC